MFLQQFFRKRALKKIKESRDVRYLSLDQINNIIVVYSPSDSGSKEIPNLVSSICAKHNIRYKIVAICKSEREKLPHPPPAAIPCLDKRKFNYGGVPKKELVESLVEEKFDLLIDMSQTHIFANYYMASAIDANFKVGRVKLEDTPFDLTLLDKANTPEGFLKTLFHYLSTINSN